MLTKSDLKQIGNVFDQRLEQGLEPIKSDLGNVKKDLKYLKKKVNRIDKTVSLVVKNYDEGDVKLARRVKRVEEHLGITDQSI